jgi:hypothetical protein
MVAVTFGGARVAAPSAVGVKPAKKGQSFLARVYDAICEAQMKRAERELALHRHMLPPDFKLERSDWSRTSRKEDEPFGGW